jgi:hypothetical protein
MDVRSFTMAHGKQASERKSRTRAVTVLAVAGALSLVAGASMTAVGPAGQKPMENMAPVITLGEEEIADVRVATFQVSPMPEKMLPACKLSKNAATEAARARSMVVARSTEAAEVTGVAADPAAPGDPMVCREIPGG